jgi:hypothetical protein
MLATRPRGTAVGRYCYCSLVFASLIVLEAGDGVIVRGQDYLYTTAVAVKLIVLVLVWFWPFEFGPDPC